MKQKNKKLEAKQDDLEQYTRKNSVRIRNVQELPNENIPDIVTNIAFKAEAQIDKKDIDNCHRIATEQTLIS